MVNIILSRRAFEELDKIYNYYEMLETGLGERFLNKFYKKYAQISSHPKIGNIKKRTYRETYLEVFPYSIVYRYHLKENEIFITSIFHFKRNSGKKYRK